MPFLTVKRVQYLLGNNEWVTPKIPLPLSS